MTTANWQRLAVIGICASAALFVGGCLWFVIGYLAPVLGLFFGGWFIACVQEPLVGWLMRRTRTSRGAAVGMTVLTVVIALVLVGLVITPILGQELGSSLISLPGQLGLAGQRLAAEQATANAWLADHGVPARVDLASGTALETAVQEMIGAPASPLQVVGGALGALGSLATMLLLSVFFLLGGPQLEEQVVHTLSSRAASDMRFVLNSVHDIFEGYARAQLLQAALFAAGAWICLSVAQVPTAPLAGIVAGFMLIVPLVGPFLAIVVPLIATLLWNPAATLPIAVLLILLEQLVLNVVGPRLMSRQLGLPPLLVLFGILAGGQVGGFWGAIFGIPLLATLMTCIDHFRPRWAAGE